MPQIDRGSLPISRRLRSRNHMGDRVLEGVSTLEEGRVSLSGGQYLGDHGYRLSQIVVRDEVRCAIPYCRHALAGQGH